MESKLELVLILSQEINEKIFGNIKEKIKSLENVISVDYKANRIYINLEGKKDFSNLIFEIFENMKKWLREYKIGARDFFVLSYEITIPANFVGKMSIPIAKSVVGNGKNCKIVFKSLEKEFLRRGVVAKTIKLIHEKSRDRKEKIIFDNKLEPKKRKSLKGKVKKGIIKNKNFYLPEGAEEISKLKENLISKLKEEFGCREIFVPKNLPLNLLEEKNLSDLIPKEAFSYFSSVPEKKELLYEISFLTGKIPRVETRNKSLLFNEIPLTLFKALENTNQKGNHYYYLDELKINLAFFENGGYNELRKKMIEFFKKILNKKEVRYRILENKFTLRNREVDYYKFEVRADRKWEKAADIFFPTDVYTSIFKIGGRSGHATIDLDKLFLIG